MYVCFFLKWILFLKKMLKVILFFYWFKHNDVGVSLDWSLAKVIAQLLSVADFFFF